MNVLNVSLRLLCGIALSVALVGCSTTESRIRKNPEVFNSLSEAKKTQVRAGRLALGDTEEMVYLALGHPDSKKVRESASGKEVTWIYNSLRSRIIYVDSLSSDDYRYLGRGGARYYHPHRGTTTTTVYDEYEAARVVFADGRVTMFEAPQR